MLYIDFSVSDLNAKISQCIKLTSDHDIDWETMLSEFEYDLETEEITRETKEFRLPKVAVHCPNYEERTAMRMKVSYFWAKERVNINNLNIFLWICCFHYSK